MALTFYVYINEQITDRVSGDCLVWVSPLKPLTLLRGKNKEQEECKL